LGAVVGGEQLESVGCATGLVDAPETEEHNVLRDPGFLTMIQGRLDGGEWIQTVAIVGSAPSAPSAAQKLGPHTIVVALNNAHRALPQVDFHVYSDDLPNSQKHPRHRVIGRSSPHYAPAVQRFGGVLHCGATTAFNAGYWAIGAFPFSQVSFFACDMSYDGDHTHFYGQGQPDPLRHDVSLQNLAAKGLRLFWMGLDHQVLFLNASAEPRSRLQLPRLASGLSLAGPLPAGRDRAMGELRERLRPLAEAALAQERRAPCEGTRHDYWRLQEQPEVWQHVAACDALWMALEPEVKAFAGWLAEQNEPEASGPAAWPA
jgi:hypothetical protein